jgi:hypothetical protein
MTESIASRPRAGALIDSAESGGADLSTRPARWLHIEFAVVLFSTIRGAVGREHRSLSVSLSKSPI